ncbi:hypothetical protein AA650_24325 [Anabaena sp. WA102]|uniref:DUF268 domain-containing protein n=1 Tax=Anabaena sp. WA102 TaxID=1647413 RepID=UPI0006BDEE51|nr:DUF268 domain-containing protein [Anabaena sp. WA102]ALB43700.1 hypothetical protein AA650_24325 [Anabaena sp. WA102]
MSQSLIPRIRYNLKIVYHVISELGFTPLNTISFFRGVPIYISQFLKFYLESQKSNRAIAIGNLFPCMIDRYEGAGHITKHYFHQDLWAARKIYQNNPEHHIDVGSRIDGFVSHVLTFRDIEILDVRPMASNVSGMTFRQADLMQSESVPVNICDSLSCLHALEHFGLGRYGDPIDPEGHIKGLTSLTKLLKPGGTLLLSVPIGFERVEFNGHRVFSVETILSLTKADYDLISFSYIDDKDDFYENANTAKVPDIIYGCGLFYLRKLSTDKL